MSGRNSLLIALFNHLILLMNVRAQSQARTEHERQ
jgi:hypothetical protein